MKFQILSPSSTPQHLLSSSQLVVIKALKRSNAREVKGLFLHSMRIDCTKINKAIYIYTYLLSSFFFSNEPKVYKNRAKKFTGGNIPRYVMIGFASSVIYVAYVAILPSPL